MFGNVWLLALTLGIFSQVIYKNTFVSEWAMHSFISFALVMNVVESIRAIQNKGIQPALGGDMLLFIPLLLGILFFTRFSVKYSFLSRWPAAIIVASGAALNFRGTVESFIVKQIEATINVLDFTNPLLAFENLLIFVTVFSTVIYFLFTREKKGVFVYTNKFSRWMMMILFGALLGNTIMTRYAGLIKVVDSIVKIFFQ
jgi:hypothetical protein